MNKIPNSQDTNTKSWNSILNNFQQNELKRIQNTINNYIRECKKDRKKSTTVKRWGRWFNIVLGFLVTGLGFTIAFPGFESWPPSYRFCIGLLNAICGVAVTFVNEYLNPDSSRKRAIAIHSIITEFENLYSQIEQKKESQIVNNKSESEEQRESQDFINVLNTTLSDLTNEAHKLGVYV